MSSHKLPALSLKIFGREYYFRFECSGTTTILRISFISFISINFIQRSNGLIGIFANLPVTNWTSDKHQMQYVRRQFSLENRRMFVICTHY